MHGVPTWEHRDAADYRDAARKDILAHYDTASFEDLRIKSLEKREREGGGTLFKAVDEHGTEWWGRKVALATGIKDVMPEIAGYDECWAHSIASVGVLAMDDCSPAPMALHLARFANRLAEKVVIYTNGNEAVTTSIKEALSAVRPDSKSAKHISLDARKISKFVRGSKKGELEIFFTEGGSKVEGFLVHKPKSALNGPWKEQLGLETTELGDYKVNFPFNETSVPGVFAAGDCSGMMKAVGFATSSGGIIGAGIASSICSED
ncbi:hypothetical protein M7I_2980 [Glarea lozoyensis 74030]|uniref:FAD/NAD(P)-binding domain-containing protein n=1 Tax=Glarea lozoyensis (strain ATCC 74030 / MF5533) TaxID=1104152 RepID=H0EK87_GLAL7|nr:hypothetical protein M7I_2980 [Glarea lozoyensis 74030]